MASNFSSRIVSAIRKMQCGFLASICLLALLLAPAPTWANPGTFVWWELENSNVPYSNLEQGMGQALQFEVSNNLLHYEFQFVMKMANDQTANNGLSAYRTNLWRGTEVGNDRGMMTNDPLTGELNPLGWSGAASYQSGSINTNESLIMNYGRSGGTGDQKLNAFNSPKAFIRLNLTIDLLRGRQPGHVLDLADGWRRSVSNTAPNAQ